MSSSTRVKLNHLLVIISEFQIACKFKNTKFNDFSITYSLKSNSCDIDLDSYLAELPARLFDTLFERIDFIKEKYQSNFFKVDQNHEMNNNSRNDELKISNKITR